MDEQQIAKSQKIGLQNRKYLNITGVRNVISFDVKELDVETELGNLTIKGRDMHVKRLSLEKGEMDVEGKVSAMIYAEDGHNAADKKNKNKKSVFARMFG